MSEERKEYLIVNGQFAECRIVSVKINPLCAACNELLSPGHIGLLAEDSNNALCEDCSQRLQNQGLNSESREVN